MGLVAAQTAPTFAQSAKSANVGSNLQVLAHAVHTEATKTIPNEQLGVMSVVLERADSGKYGSNRNLRAVVYNGEFNGPENHPAPWKTEPASFKATESLVRPYYDRWAANEALNLPAGAKCAVGAWHFDMRPHTDWGTLRCKIGLTWFYNKRTAKVASTKKHHGRNAVYALSRHHGDKHLLTQNNTKKPKAVLTGKSDLKVASR